METIQHLLYGCCFSRQVWHDVLSWLRATCNPPEQGDTLLSWWNKAKHATPKPLRKGLASIALLTPWLIWKQRNDCVFNRAEPSVHNVVIRIRDEAALWARAGAPGLCVLLPQNWDVHLVVSLCFPFRILPPVTTNYFLPSIE
jgi:hypothetical protein